MRSFLLLAATCLCAIGLLAQPSIPVLNWTERSDWVNVKTAVTPRAVGDGVADDTAALQKALDGVTDGSVIYLPAGTYRITNTLRFKIDRDPAKGPQHRVAGLLVLGHGRETKLVWDGPVGKEMLLESGATMSRYQGIVFDGRGKATVGLHHFGQDGTFETEVSHRDLAFLNFTDAGILAKVLPATSEVMIENCLFDNCKRGIAFLNFNEYDYTIDGCEFRRCGKGIECFPGNTYIRNCHFEGSTEVDIWLHPEHGCSVRRCTSHGSYMFISSSQSPVAPLTVQDCQVAGWTGPDGAIGLAGAPMVLFDCVFTQAPSKLPPVQILSANLRLFVSQNVSAATDGVYGVYTPKRGKIYEIPAGKRKGTLTSANQRFLHDTEAVPTVVFDARKDFGAKGNGNADDTEAIQKTIDATRAHGKGAIAYLPTGTYVVTKPLRITGAHYTIGGTGYATEILWGGPEGGNIAEVLDPDDVTLENLVIGTSFRGGEWKNAIDILQTSTGDTPSSMTYDNVTVYGMYQKDPFRKGLWLRGLSKASTVRVRHIEGNIHLVDAARATVLLGNTYEGSVVVEGKAKERDGFLGILTRLGTISNYVLYIKDNHSLVASDFYVEQAVNALSLEGSPEDPPGRITLQMPKLQIGSQETDLNRMAFDIHGYHGQLACGPVLYYVVPATMNFTHTGTGPLEALFWASYFYGTKLVVKKDDAAHVTLFGCAAITRWGQDVTVEETQRPETLPQLSLALDDLRALGELDLKLNYPRVVAPPKNLYLLAVGVGRYPQLPVAAQLATAVPDATAFAQAVQRQGGAYPYVAARVALLTDEKASLPTLKQALRQVKDLATEDDTVLIYFSGHGLKDAGGQYYFPTYNADVKNLPGTALSLEDVRAALREVRTPQLLVLADTCQSGEAVGAGQATNGLLAEKMNGDAHRMVFIAGQGSESSVKKPAWGHGAFTLALLEALDGKADENQDGLLAYWELADYVRARVMELTDGRQHPQLSFLDQFDSDAIVARVAPTGEK